MGTLAISVGQTLAKMHWKLGWWSSCLDGILLLQLTYWIKQGVSSKGIVFKGYLLKSVHRRSARGTVGDKAAQKHHPKKVALVELNARQTGTFLTIEAGMQGCRKLKKEII